MSTPLHQQAAEEIHASLNPPVERDEFGAAMFSDSDQRDYERQQRNYVRIILPVLLKHFPASDSGDGETPKIAPVQGYQPGIPWELHLEAYAVYCKKHGPQKSLIEGWCRGGFGTYELDMFIPGWRDKVGPINDLKAENSRLKARVEQAERLLEDNLGRMERRYIEAELMENPISEDHRDPLYRRIKAFLSKGGVKC